MARVKTSVLLIMFFVLIPLSPSKAFAEPQMNSPSLGWLAYIQNGDVWMKELPDGQARRLTTDGHNHSPRWSPSGEFLTFANDKGSWVIKRSGEQAKSFDPANCSERLQYSYAASCYPVNGSLVVRNADGSGTRVITSVELTAGRPITGTTVRIGGPILSPDRKWFAYDLMKVCEGQVPCYAYSGIWVAESDWRNVREVHTTGIPPQDDLAVFGWSLDSKAILFTRDPGFGISSTADGIPLEAVSIKGDKPREITEPFLWNYLDWSPDKRFLVIGEGFDRQTWTNKHITVYDLLTLSKTQLTDNRTAAISPAWSPDAQHIAFVAMADIGSVGGGDAARNGMMRRRIWVMNRDGSNKHRLTNDANYRDERPQWSADGSHILFVRLDPDDHLSLWLMRSDGSELVVADNISLPPQESIQPPIWFGYYGGTDWEEYYDWWQVAHPTSLPATGGSQTNTFPWFAIGVAVLLAGVAIYSFSQLGN